MTTAETHAVPNHIPDRIEADTIAQQAGLSRTFNELRERLDHTKQTKDWWGQVKQQVVNSAFVAADDVRLAVARAQMAPPRQGVTLPALGLLGASVLLVIAVRRRKP